MADERRDEFERIRNGCDQAQPGEGQFPGWNGETIPSLPQFFDRTAHLWDDVIGAPGGLHVNMAAQVEETDEPIRILDVGCGTGLEFAHLFERAPNAHITGLDQAPRMLAQVREKYADRLDQITLVESSCLEWPEWSSDFDYVVSALALHHFGPDAKVGIYRDIKASLKDGGTYIEGDQSAAGPEPELDTLKQYEAWIARLPDGDRGGWNYDVTLSVETNCRLLREAGFDDCEMTWEKRNKGGSGHAVIVAR